MTERLRLIINGVIGLVVLAAGTVTMTWLIRRPAEASLSTTPAALPQVRVQRVDPVVFSEPVVGYGTVRPKRQVKIIPQVSGLLTYVNETLAVGKTVRQNELLFEIDARPYRSSVQQVKANIKQLEVQRQILEQENRGLTTRLVTARKLVALAQKNYQRELELQTDGATSDPEMELAEERFLQRQDAISGYQNQLNLIPFRMDEIDARLDVLHVQLEDAQRNVERTRIVAPFDARVDLVNAQQSQVVIANLAIATLTDLAAFELPAVIEPRDLIWADRALYARVMGGDLGMPPEVKVTWTTMGRRFTWRGTVSRLERHDEATRTDRIVVEIPNVSIDATDEHDPLRRNLSIGMFCQAELPAEPLHEALVVPRHAIYEDQWVYVFDPVDGDPNALDGTLAMRRVPMLRVVGDRVLVYFASEGSAAGIVFDDTGSMAARLASCELLPGEEIIVSPLANPVLGMHLQRRVELALHLPTRRPDESWSTFDSPPIESMLAAPAPTRLVLASTGAHPRND